MSVIRIDLDHPLQDIEEVTFKAACACSSITGLKVYYPSGSSTTSKTFTLRDAQLRNLCDNASNVFAANAIVKALLDKTTGNAYILNESPRSYTSGWSLKVVETLPDEEDRVSNCLYFCKG